MFLLLACTTLNQNQGKNGSILTLKTEARNGKTRTMQSYAKSSKKRMRHLNRRLSLHSLQTSNDNRTLLGLSK
jgi:hypothetical protein